MWLCTQHGFFSIVQKTPTEYHVRARIKQDLQNLKEVGGWDWPIHRSVGADYRWRIVVEQADVLAIMLNLGEAIDYVNFKGRIHDLPDQAAKGRAYGTLWGNLHDLQERHEPPGA